AIESPDSPISELRLLSEDERRQVLVEFNRTERDYPGESIHRMFEGQAERAPDKVAVVWGGQRVSYGELNRRADRIGHRLEREGVGVETLVGICVGRSIEMVAGLLGALKAGCAYVPLDPNYPGERLRLMYEDSRAAALLTERRLLGRLPQSGARALCLDEECERDSAEAWDEGIDLNPGVEVGWENLAYVIYTSGSTGRPKGVGITHRSASRLVEWAQESYEAEDLNGVLASTSI